MKNTLKKNKTQKVKNKNENSVIVLILLASLITGIILFACGCEELFKQAPAKSPAKSPAKAPAKAPAVDISEQRTEATRIILEALADNNDPLVRVNAIEVVATT